MHNGKPVIVLCGDGGSGKDYVAEVMAGLLNLPYKCSTSYIAAVKMWDWIDGKREPMDVCEPRFVLPEGQPPFSSLENFYSRRAQHRRYWSDWIDWYNERSASKAALYLDSVAAGNHLITGIRKKHEFLAFEKTGLIDLSIWIHRPGIARDITQEYGPELCDLTMPNDDLLGVGADFRLRVRLDHLKKFLLKYGETL